MIRNAALAGALDHKGLAPFYLHDPDLHREVHVLDRTLGEVERAHQDLDVPRDVSAHVVARVIDVLLPDARTRAQIEDEQRARIESFRARMADTPLADLLRAPAGTP